MQQKKMRASRSRGMTLLEIMVVLVILGIMATGVAVVVFPRIEEAKRDPARTEIKAIESPLPLFYARKGNYPEPAVGVKPLIDMQLLDRTKDPWGKDYVYMLQGGKPMIISYGRDGQPGGEGPDADISNRDSSQAQK